MMRVFVWDGNSSSYFSYNLRGREINSQDAEAEIKAYRDKLKVSMDKEEEMQKIILSLNEELSHQKSEFELTISEKERVDTKPNIWRPGVIVLGMHRSGTSIVGGLMSKMGLQTGHPLIPPNFDNEKGFFERIDVVLQNDNLMQKQSVHYAYNTHTFDTKLGLKHILENEREHFFSEGRRGLAFLNSPSSYPWMLKDPRLCITLRTWLPLLNFIPSTLFTYRNPFDVALSMHTRETEHFPIQRGLKLWYIYNKRAIVQSNDLCRVVTSHRKVMTQPTVEMKRIYDGLIGCGVPVPHMVSEADINSFIDTSLQHGKTSIIDQYCSQMNSLSASPDEISLSSIHPPPDKWDTSDPGHLYLYRSAVKAYCDMESGVAFSHDYVWDETIEDS
jgi:hypothetical protein